MNAVAKVEQPRTSLIATMAAKYQMDPDQFAKTVRATVMPAQHTNEQFAALMLVANEYDLNPVVKEIYAFPAKGGGIVPIVSIDGWLNLMNSHPAFDGMETEFIDDTEGNPVSCTCRIWRKDRSRPIVVTEYLAECIRNTEPWKMRRRMLRHKSVIQCSRYAFGFSGIYDEDEGAKIAEMRDVTPTTPQPPRPPVPPKQIAVPAEQEEPATEADVIDVETGEVIENAQVDEMAEGDGQAQSFVETNDQPDEGGEVTAVEDEKTPSDLLTALDDDLAVASDEATVMEIWGEHDLPARLTHAERGDEFVSIAKAVRDRHLKRVRK
jgi:phage recombination protein Bet